MGKYNQKVRPACPKQIRHLNSSTYMDGIQTDWARENLLPEAAASQRSSRSAPPHTLALCPATSQLSYFPAKKENLRMKRQIQICDCWVSSCDIVGFLVVWRPPPLRGGSSARQLPLGLRSGRFYLQLSPAPPHLALWVRNTSILIGMTGELFLGGGGARRGAGQNFRKIERKKNQLICSP